MKKLTLFAALTMMLPCTLSISSLKAQTNIYKLHYLFVYNFVENTKWENIGSEFTNGVFSNNEIYKDFEKNFANKSIVGIPFSIVGIARSSEATNFQIVHIPKINSSKTTA